MQLGYALHAATGHFRGLLQYRDNHTVTTAGSHTACLTAAMACRSSNLEALTLANVSPRAVVQLLVQVGGPLAAAGWHH
jgi:hypothetical protein